MAVSDQTQKPRQATIFLHARELLASLRLFHTVDPSGPDCAGTRTPSGSEFGLTFASLLADSFSPAPAKLNRGANQAASSAASSP
jgi:hypothetical protein